ncbi:hypothetical protein [Pedobacter gandavensis]|uniref:hypothetical protein n=1 Tax=Pedobacter gandavensis TaxID=2679963 RepID=UPI00292ED898|nr:hypothetical protein [Pedobacter gandavensis]
MKRKLLVIFTAILCCGLSYGQTLKTGVLVIGNGSNALGAGLQSAMSGVKTTLLLEGEDFELSLMDPGHQSLASGLELRLLNKLRTDRGIKGSASLDHIDPQKANAIIKDWVDSTKNLTIIRKVVWSKLKRSGAGWTVQLNNGQNIKAAMLVYAAVPGKLKELLSLNQLPGLQWKALDYQNLSYRTSLSSGFVDRMSGVNLLSLYDLLIPGQESLVWLNPEQESIAGGQAAGATAAYPVFFKLKARTPNLKAIQNELMNYRLSLVPFVDVNPTDSNWKAVQFIGISGFLKGVLVGSELKFNPEQKVSTLEIKTPIKDFFYKAQIWFDDYTAAEMTIGSSLDLVCKVGNKAPVTTLAEVKKRWKTQYHFNTEFDLERPITRREFAVLLQEYLNPFNVNIDPTGRVIR